MVDRLGADDVSFLYLEEPTTPMQVGSVAVFDAAGTQFGYETVLRLVRDRLAYVPRYRQRIRWVPGRIANPVWVDDEDFDLSYHVRQSAVPRPGTDEQLRDLVARVFSRPLDRSRPLWELYVVEGLTGDRVAIVAKTHQAVVDGVTTVDIGQVILDDKPAEVPEASETWRPEPEPSTLELVSGAVTDAIRRPSGVVDSARGAVADVRLTAAKVTGAVGDVKETVANVTGRVADAVSGVAGALVTAARPAPDSPLKAVIGAQRRYTTVDTRLEDYRRVRAAHGGSVNDVVLATIAGALRSWLLTRGVPMRGTTTIRAMVPVSVHDDEPSPAGDRPGAATGLGGRVDAYVVDLPVGEPNPVMRLHQISYAMNPHHEGGRAVSAPSLVGLAGFAPPTLHALGARVAGSLSRRMANVVVTNVPGPQTPLYAADAQMLVTYPVVPLAKGQALAIGLTSYDGAVCFGLIGDRDAMADLDVLAQCVPDAVAELLDTVGKAPPAPGSGPVESA